MISVLRRTRFFRCRTPRIMENATCFIIRSPEFVLAMRTVVGIVCILSALGAGLIIITYVAFKDLRTTARLLMVHLSVADIIVAISHFVGLQANYERFINFEDCSVNKTTDDLCTTQGAVTMFGVLASFLWTTAVALYLFVVIVLQKFEAAKKLHFMFYPICWGISAALAVYYAAVGYIGFQRSQGWCYIGVKDPVTVPVFGYELWSYVAFFSSLVFYIAIHCHVKFKILGENHCCFGMQTQAKLKPTAADTKLLFVPLVFLCLRVWNAAEDIPAFYLSDSAWHKFKETWISAVLIFLEATGDSAQGLANAILFCFFTKLVREKLVKALTCRQQYDPRKLESAYSNEETTQLTSTVESIPQQLLGNNCITYSSISNSTSSD